MCFVGSFLFAFSAFELALAHEWAGLVITVVSSHYSLPEWVRIRAILRHSRELAPVRAAHAVETRPRPVGPTMKLQRLRAAGGPHGRDCATTSFSP